MVHPEIAAALDIGTFVSVAKDSRAAVAAAAASGTIDHNVVLVPKALRTACGILLGDRVQVAPYNQQPRYAGCVDVHVDNDNESSVRKVLASAGVLQAGAVYDGEHPVTVVGVYENEATRDKQSEENNNTKNTNAVGKNSGGSTDDIAALSSSLELMHLTPQVMLYHTSTAVRIVAATKTTPHAFAHVGGLDRTVALLRSTVRLPLHYPGLFHDYGILPPRGILLHGPPGTGKTMLLRCVAHECDAHVLTLSGLVVLKYLGETETAVREVFAEASRYQPLVILMDEMDLLAPKRGLDDAGEAESRVVATLLTMMDGMAHAGRVVVVGATNRPNSIDPALRRPGRFDHEVEVGVPDVAARADILRRQLARMNAARCAVTPDDVEAVAARTHGYVGADLAALCREAAMRAIGRELAGLGLSLGDAWDRRVGKVPGDLTGKKEGDSKEESDSVVDSTVAVSAAASPSLVTREDLLAALADVRPSAMREVFLEMPRVSWDDIAGQHDLKRKLVEVVQLPLSAAPAFARLGVAAPKGVLLYGPPGCSKTLTAKALASESGLNFLAVKGPEIFNKYVGESERTVREVFRRARAAAPSIIFFDEIDALASTRDALTLAAQHVLTALLNEIDGIEELRGVVVVAATNRPSELDPALLRPGRLDRHIYVGPPDRDARLAIITRRCSKFDVADREELFARLADATDGCSGAEVALLCQEAGLAAIMEDRTTTAVLPRHFDHALEGISRGITPEMLEYFGEFAGRSGLAL